MIRRFTPSDLPTILQIEKESFPKSPYSWVTFMELYALYPETFLVFTQKSSEEEKEKILGYIVFSSEGHIISIAVHPHCRRKGIGRTLIQMAMENSFKKELWAEVRRSNRGAQAFYLQMGFKIIGVVPNYYGNEDALIVQWVSLQ
ncbi:MAG: ribosomal protein S18-alanine N-acetyltransferase [Thermodesulfobacteriota bacterium]